MVAAPTKFWNDAAQKYASRPVANVPAFEAKKAAIKARLAPGDAVLEVGCGTGTVAIELAGSVGHVHAVDLSEEMIRIARKRAADAGVTNVTFHVGSVDDLADFHPGQFDMICALNLLHLLEDRGAALAKFFELLKPGGCFAETTVVLGDSWVPYRPLIAVMKWFGKAPPVWIIREDILHEEIDQAGFRGLEQPPIPAGSTVTFSITQKPFQRAVAEPQPSV